MEARYAEASHSSTKAGIPTVVVGSAMAASPMAKYTAELQSIRAVLVQAQSSQLELEAKLKEVDSEGQLIR